MPQSQRAAPLTAPMQAIIDKIERAQRAPFHTLTPQQAFDAYAAGADVLEVPAQPCTITPLSILAENAAPITGVLFEPPNNQGPRTSQNLLVYLHGGGFTVGSSTTHAILCRELATLAHCAVASIDYRLSPQARFPAAVLDCWAAVQNLAPQFRATAVGGDSAGGTLAAVCALHARDAKLPLALQLLFYPACDPLGRYASRQIYGEGYVLTDATRVWFDQQCAPTALEQADWRFSPALAPDHEGVAAAWFGLAECDPLVDEGLAYADKLRAAGVPVDLEIYQGVTHEFIKMGRVIPTARQAHADAARALRTAFANT